MDISCAFPPGRDTPDLVTLAEELGYRRAWLYDSPALYADVWMTLARCADRTSRIGLGPAVVVPSLRHVMTTAAAVATLESLAPGRVAMAVGTGFTGRLVLGQRPLTWAEVARYVEALRRLLRGDEVEWDGAAIRMIHPETVVTQRPVAVPILVGAQGPKGVEVARQVGDGAFSASAAQLHEGFDWSVALGLGTVLDDGETYDSPRVIDAVGPVACVAYHFLYEHGSAAGLSLDSLPGGAEWKAEIDALPERTRHLELHDGHMVFLPERDRKVVTGDLVAGLTFTGTREDLAGRLKTLEEAGLTELAVQPAGPDPERELRAFAALIP